MVNNHRTKRLEHNDLVHILSFGGLAFSGYSQSLESP